MSTFIFFYNFAENIFCCKFIMEPLYKIKKGLDINLDGVARKESKRLSPSVEYAISPSDFTGVSPRLVVKEGDSVKAGDTLFVDKATERICFVAPVGGKIVAIERGERRKLQSIRIKYSEAQEYKENEKLKLESASREDVLEYLLGSGMFAYIRQRPYDVIASPADSPKAIFVSAFSKMPLAADVSYVLEGREEDFKLGVQLLSKLAPVYLGISPEQINTAILPVAEAKVCVFDGPNPSGNVGVHINHVSPINKGEIVWTVGAEIVAMMGVLVRTGQINLTRRVAVAGSCVAHPSYVEAIIGTPLADLLSNQIDMTAEHIRIINGNPLVGVIAAGNGSLGSFNTEVCVIPEGDDVHEVLGWIRPRLHDFSTNRSYFSWLMGHSKIYNLDCRIKGGQRHMIMSAEYEKVFPMDIYPSYLIKAIITGDIDRQEALGIYEVAPEDFAVAEFVDSSKLELQRIVREGLDILRKENS